MPDFGTAVRDAARRALCRRLSPVGAAADFFENLTIGLPGGARIPTTPSVIGQAINAYLDRCPASGGPYPPYQGPQFTGGQCNTQYNVGAQYDLGTPGNGPFGPGAALVPGPVQEVFIVPGVNYVQIRAAGQVYPLYTASGGAPQPYNVRNVTVTRTDGLPDNCGDPPGEGETIIYDPPTGGPQVEIDVDFQVGSPRINLSGQIVVPIFAPELSFSPQLDFNLNTGDIDFNFGGDPDNSPCCLPPETDEPPGPDPPPDEEGLPIVGAIVKAIISQPVTATEVWLDNGPNLWVPRLGTVTFASKVDGEGGAEWLTPIDIKAIRTYVPCPASQGATAVVANGIAGVSLQVAVVRARIPSTVSG